MKANKNILTRQELEIMKMVWDRGETTVRDVYEALREERKIAYTTVMSMMKTLEEKGHLAKRPQGRAYVYRPTQSKRQVVRKMVRDFIDRVFDGSAQPLLLHLIRERHVSEKEVDEIRRMIRKQRP